MKTLLDDPNRDVSYNAATGLARLGDTAAIDTLLGMLNPTPLSAPSGGGAPNNGKSDDPDVRTDPTVVIVNGLTAIDQLADANPTADLNRLTSAVAALEKPGLPLDIRDRAMALSAKLSKRPAGAKASS